jgi:hypothetical protein
MARPSAAAFRLSVIRPSHGCLVGGTDLLVRGLHGRRGDATMTQVQSPWRMADASAGLGTERNIDVDNIEQTMNNDADFSPLPQRKIQELSMPQAIVFDSHAYEQACDQAIAMCDGNLRSTIRALIMANEYLELELQELRAAISRGCMPNTCSDAHSDAA